MQNEKTLQQMIREYEAQIPSEIMNIIKGFDWKKQVRMIVNQNQLLLDVASDLEESVYLMILGAVDVEEVFDRMMEVHELPQDKVQKILSEVEEQIFAPMHTQLSKIDVTKAPQAEVSPQINSIEDVVVSEDVDMEDIDPNTLRDQTLSEIEKDIELQTPQSRETNTVQQEYLIQTPGVAQSFSLNSTKENYDEDNPVATSLNQTTISEPQIIKSQNPVMPPIQNPGHNDPYREPIE